jgi:uncharacterized membrane protein YGL010W
MVIHVMRLVSPTNRYFRRQLAIYSRYHGDTRNCLTHWVGIPLIFFSVLLVLGLWQVPLLNGRIEASIGSIFLIPAITFWIALDVGVGIVMLPLIVPLAVTAEWIARIEATVGTLFIALICFIAGWLCQIIGHAVFERRKPAFFDDLSQMLIGPMFLGAKTLVGLGYRRDLADALDACVQHGI